MPHFTLQVSPQGASLTAFIGVSAARESALKEAGQEVPKLARIQALIDTGASVTCVDPLVLKTSLNLSPTGNTTIISPSTGNQPVPVDQYDVALYVPPALDDEMPLIVGTLPVVCAELYQAQGFHALIGRDVLAKCIFSYNGTCKHLHQLISTLVDLNL